MNNNQVKGKLDNLKGRVKEAAGALTGDKELEAEGVGQRVKGAGQEAVGNVQKKVSDAVDNTRADADEDADVERADVDARRDGRGNA